MIMHRFISFTDTKSLRVQKRLSSNNLSIYCFTDTKSLRVQKPVILPPPKPLSFTDTKSLRVQKQGSAKKLR